MANQVLSLLPALDTLIKYKKQHHHINEVFETILNEIEETEKCIHKLLVFSEKVGKEFIQAANTEKSNQVRKNTPKIAKSRRKLDELNSKKIDKSSEKYLKKQIVVLPNRISLKDEKIRIEAMLRQHRMADMAKLFNQKLERNTKICQLMINLLNGEKNAKYQMKMKMYKYWICQHCDFAIRNQYEKNGFSKVLRNHFESCHPSIKFADHGCANIFTLTQAYGLLQRKLQSSGKEYYKCNCQIQPCSTPQQYIRHIKSVHNNQVPSYSSHLFSQNGHLTTNQNFNQLCVIEDMITHQTYYCGQCDIAFQRRPDVFYSHISHYHDGSTNHPLTSHHFKLNHDTKLEKHSLVQNKKRGRRPVAKQQQIPLKEQSLLNQSSSIRQLHSLSTKQIQKSSPSVGPRRRGKGKNKGNEQKKLKQKGRKVSKFKPFPEEQKFMKMIQNYKGPFICSVCNKDFEDHEGIVNHLQSFPVSNTHLKKQKNWMRVRIKKIKQNEQYFLYVPIAEQFMNIQLTVPYYEDNIIKNQQMTYEQFLAFAIIKNKYYNNFIWLYYSECPDQEQQNEEENLENESNTDMEEYREKEETKRQGKVMYMNMDE